MSYFQEIKHRWDTSSVFWRNLLQIWLDTEAWGPVIATQAISEKNQDLENNHVHENTNAKKQKRLRKVEGEILQNLIWPGIFIGWKGTWHIISGGQRGPVMFLMLVLEMLTVLLMLTSAISLKVALWSIASMNQAFVLAFFSASLTKELGDLYFSSWEKQVSNLFLYIQKKNKIKIIIISVLNMAYDILKSRCMLGLAWYREWWSMEVLIRGMKPRLIESSGKFVFGLNKALIIFVVFLPIFFFFLIW